MTVNPGDVLEVVARMEFNGVDDVVNVYQYQYQGVVPLTDAQATSGVITIIESLYTLLQAVISILQLYRDIRITNITQATLLGTHPWPTLTAGSGTGDPVPPGVTALLNFTTAIARVSPRKYIGVLVEPGIGPDGRIVAGSLVQLSLAGAFLLAQQTVLGQPYQYGYFSPKTINFEIPNAVVVTDIPAYQRRRKQGRGS